MMTELEAMMDGDTVSMVFLYGSAAMLVVSMILVTWLCETKNSPAPKRTSEALLKVAPHRN